MSTRTSRPSIRACSPPPRHLLPHSECHAGDEEGDRPTGVPRRGRPAAGRGRGPVTSDVAHQVSGEVGSVARHTLTQAANVASSSASKASGDSRRPAHRGRRRKPSTARLAGLSGGLDRRQLVELVLVQVDDGPLVRREPRTTKPSLLPRTSTNPVVHLGKPTPCGRHGGGSNSGRRASSATSTSGSARSRRRRPRLMVRSAGYAPASEDQRLRSSPPSLLRARRRHRVKPPAASSASRRTATSQGAEGIDTVDERANRTPRSTASTWS